MKLISENIHIISKEIKDAILTRNESVILDLLYKIKPTLPDWIDLNIGPAKKDFAGSMQWLVKLLKQNTNLPLSFDSSNLEEIESGLKIARNPSMCIINSTTAEPDRLETITDMAKKYDCNLIALTLNKKIGIPKMADDRLELAFSIIEKTMEKNIDNSKIFFDPLILPISVDQSQSIQALDTIRMFKASFDPPTSTTIGLSNVSNGSPRPIRALINQVFFVLAAGCGLDTAIVDSFDIELSRINKVIESRKVEHKKDSLFLALFDMMQGFGELEDISYDKSDVYQVQIYKTAQILLNKNIYSHSYLDI